VRETGAEQVAFVIDEDLGLVFQSAKGARMDDPVTVALKARAIVRFFLGVFPPAGVLAANAIRSKGLVLDFFKLLSAINHAKPLRKLYVYSICAV